MNRERISLERAAVQKLREAGTLVKALAVLLQTETETSG
jgi:hypothetical protein